MGIVLVVVDYVGGRRWRRRGGDRWRRREGEEREVGDEVNVRVRVRRGVYNPKFTPLIPQVLLFTFVPRLLLSLGYFY